MNNLKIYYGSQTGTAQDLAEKIYKYSEHLSSTYITSEIHEMNSLNFDTLSTNDILIFVCSTTGQGDPPDNMKIFWQTIMKKSFNIPLNSYNFAVFGLGDSKYIKFNFIAKKLYRRLVQFKANPIVPLGLADDQHTLGIDGEFLPWINKLWNHFEDKLGPSVGITNAFSMEPIRKYAVEIIKTVNSVDQKCPVAHDTFHFKSNLALTPSNHFQDTRLISFHNKNLSYDVGDIFTVFPENCKINTNLFFDLTTLNRFDVISVTCVNPYFKLPESVGDCLTTVENLVIHAFDLNSVPRKSFFENFAFLSMFELEKERLMELSDPKNIDELYSYCYQPKRTIIEVLQDFPKTTKLITLFQWMNLMSFIRPRDYSIASSSIVHTQEIQLLISRVQFKTKMYNHRVGLCSNFLCDLKPNDRVFGKIKKGSLKFPHNNLPVILISPGTGIAAFRGYISERMMNEKIAETLLCFGNRYKHKDFYFSNEFEGFQNEKKMKLLTAFSREENMYIQDKLKQQSEMIWKIISEWGGYLFICGRSVDMPQQVHNEIKYIIMNEGGVSDIEAENILITMQKYKRYQLETWS